MTVDELIILLQNIPSEDKKVEVLMEGCDCYQKPLVTEVNRDGKVPFVLIKNEESHA